ncbi:uncharacterized protein [Aegilops tauschii subsp. strangulata]|nr:uncharacterized protein LOC109748867 [Aegilops tauschii subsp. strangulata]
MKHRERELIRTYLDHSDSQISIVLALSPSLSPRAPSNPNQSQVPTRSWRAKQYDFPERSPQRHQQCHLLRHLPLPWAGVLADHQEQGRGGVQVGPVRSDAAQLHALGVLRHPLHHIRLDNGKVIKTKSVEYMPFFLSLLSFLNGVCWMSYALIKFDLYVTIPNGLGALFGLVLACYYRPTPKKEKSANLKYD